MKGEALLLLGVNVTESNPGHYQRKDPEVAAARILIRAVRCDSLAAVPSSFLFAIRLTPLIIVDCNRRGTLSTLVSRLIISN
jgi:hypothetical protein